MGTNERRLGERKTAITNAFLNHPKLTNKSLRTRDLSARGVFVETNQGHKLDIGDKLGVTFAVNVSGVTKLHQFDGIVAQIRPDGIGLRITPAAA